MRRLRPRSPFHNRALSRLAILSGFCIEVVMSLGIVSGVADRAAALVLAAYCAATALLWKQFWKSGDFRLRGPSRGRDTFWDFLKNFALAGGFLSLAFAGHAVGVGDFLHHPLRLIASLSKLRIGRTRLPSVADSCATPT